MSETEEVPVSTQDASRTAQGDNDKPPSYEDVGFASAADEPCPVTYNQVLEEKAQEHGSHTAGTLIAEPPPTYVQLFGQQHRSTNRRSSPLDLRQDRQSPDDSTDGASRRSAISRNVLGVVVILLFLTVPISMVIVGITNYSVCRNMEVPLYLIVAGVLISVEVVMHGLYFFCRSHIRESSSLERARRCDLLMFILFVLLLVGTNWMFQSGFSSNCDQADGGIQTTNVTVEVNGTTTAVTVDVGADESTEEGGVVGRDCEEDCSEAVYLFTAVVILVQYVIALLAVGYCCSRLCRKSRN